MRFFNEVWAQEVVHATHKHHVYVTRLHRGSIDSLTGH